MRTIAFALAVVLLFGIVRAQNEGQVVWIGRINEDYSYNWLNAVSANGDTAVGISTDNVDRRTAFVWNRTTGITALQNGFQGYATDITPDGTIIVGSAPSTGHTACRWVNGIYQNLGDLPGQTDYSRANGISDSGSVIVGFGRNATDDVPFRWEGTFLELGNLGADYWSEAMATSFNGGVIVGNTYSSTGTGPFRWTPADGSVALVGPGSIVGSRANDVTPDGSIIVGTALFPEARAARWHALTGFVSLGLPPGGIASYGNAISADGNVVVGLAHMESNDFTAMIWSPAAGMKTLPQYLADNHVALTGDEHFDEVNDVSQDGRTFVGKGITPGEHEGQGFIIKMPEWDTWYPTGFNVPEGLILSGSLESLYFSDMDGIGVLSDYLTLGAELNFYTASPTATPYFMTFEFQGHATRPGLAQVLSLRNYLTGNYDIVDGRLAPSAETFIHAQTTNPSRYVGTNNAARARVEWFPLNDEDPSQDGWLHSINVARWRIRS